ncbi:hypothetical protein Ctaglu_20380 [Clostridium tagluense]|uniref:Uncharacterized protein n=1 Tax=Clostridium tagluense TaxID=360422 RepID=A0A401ULL0_9CLOT|nr:hypothetical protein Ctaglu_20380 [Clostridium tagluense]
MFFYILFEKYWNCTHIKYYSSHKIGVSYVAMWYTKGYIKSKPKPLIMDFIKLYFLSFNL